MSLYIGDQSPYGDRPIVGLDQIALPTGRVIPLNYVTFDDHAQRFFYGGLDVTPYLVHAQKTQFPGFDVERANNEASDAARLARGLEPVRVADTSALSLFAQGVAADVTGLATGLRNFAGIGPENAGKRSPLFWTLLLAGLAFLAYQLGLFAWLRKKLSA